MIVVGEAKSGRSLIQSPPHRSRLTLSLHKPNEASKQRRMVKLDAPVAAECEEDGTGHIFESRALGSVPDESVYMK